MFSPERFFQQERQKWGDLAALRRMGDIHPLTTLYGPQDKIKNARPSLDLQNLVLDINEHFVELSNPGEYRRSLINMLALLPVMVLVGLSVASIWSISNWSGVIDSWGDKVATILGWCLTLAGYAFFYYLRPREAFLTALRARYRFNRTTGKVYIVRPRKFGGNAVLDWSRVRAHVQWRPPVPDTEDQGNPSIEQNRERLAQMRPEHHFLVLYWPPLDPADPQRRGEDLIFVGREGTDTNAWEYIRTFMNKGLDAVPMPQKFEWLRKGFSSVDEAQDEVLLRASTLSENLTGRSDATDWILMFSSFFERYNHVLGERMCYWPTFPEAWNSDCGQRRREEGLGAEEPLRWTPSGAVVQGEIPASECQDHSEPTPAQWRRMLAWTALHIAIGTAMLVLPVWWMRS